jgi:hypothetical protein
MGTGPLLVPKSNVICGNPRLSELRRNLTQPQRVRSRAETPPPHAQSRSRIAQEAAGSSPASSIAGVRTLASLGFCSRVI